MTQLRALLLCLIVGCLAVGGNPGSADAASRVKFSGGCVFPIDSNTGIRMDAMEVTFRLRNTGYTVDAVFHLFNTEAATTQQVAFPKFGFGQRLPVIDFVRFDAWIDGKKAAFSEDRDLHPKTGPFYPHCSSYARTKVAWLVSRVSFPGKAITRHRVRYDALNTGGGTADFYFGTGRHWKGPIGKAVFTIDGTDVGGAGFVGVSSVLGFIGPRRVGRNIVRYELRAFEPSLESPLFVQGGR